MPISKNQIKAIQKLHRKKYRDVEGVYLVEGEKMAAEAIRHCASDIREIYASQDWIFQNGGPLNAESLVPEDVLPSELKKISTLQSPNQVLMVMQQREIEMDWSSSGLFLYLDRIQDPGNMGTILSIANWFGLQGVITHNCVEIYNPKVVQASMGAVFHLNFLSLPFDELRSHLPNAPIWVSTLYGKSINELSDANKGIIVIGNESQGVAPEIIEQATQQVTIPSFGESPKESLNAAVATGIICAAFRRGS